jgi:hypothetical protein
MKYVVPKVPATTRISALLNNNFLVFCTYAAFLPVYQGQNQPAESDVLFPTNQED